jgi:MFS family permease
VSRTDIQLHNLTKRRFFYGYYIVLASFFIMVAYSGARSAFGIFFNPMAGEFDWSATALSTAFSISIIMDGLLGIFMGRFADRVGPRIVLTVAGLLMALGFFLMSRVTSIWQMYLAYGLLVGTGMGGVFVPLITSLARWFIARRSTMNGIVLAGMGIGQLITPPIANWLILTVDWERSFVILSIAIFTIAIFAQLLRKSPAEVGQKPYNRPTSSQFRLDPESRNYTLKEASRTIGFWVVFFMFFCIGFSGISLAVHLVPHIIDLGMSGSTGASILAAVGGANIFGRLSMGAVADKIGNKRVNIICFVMMLLMLVWLIFIGQTWEFVVFALLFGFGQGGVSLTMAPIIADLFGLKSHGLIYGSIGFGAMVGGTAGPILMGYIFDATGGYQMAFIISSILAAAGVALAITLLRARMKGAARV